MPMGMQKITIKCPRCNRTSISFYFFPKGECPACGLEYVSNVLAYRRISSLIAIPLVWLLDKVFTRAFDGRELMAMISVAVVVIMLDFFLSAVFVHLVPRQ